MTTLNADEMVTSMELANRYMVTPSMLQRWRESRDFPEDAVQRRGQYTYWHVPSVDEYLRGRLAKKAKFTYGTGPRPRWADLVMKSA